MKDPSPRPDLELEPAPDAGGENLYATAPYPYQSLDEQGRFLYVNPAWCDLFGYGLEDVVGSSWPEYLDPRCRDLASDRFSGFKQSGRVTGYLFDVRHRDGLLIPIRLDGRISYLPDGAFERTHCFLIDMRPELKARQQLMESEEKYRSLLDRVQGGIWEIDRDGRSTYGNKALCDMLGVTEEEFLGSHMFDYMDERGIEMIKGHLARREQGIAEQHDHELIAKDGRRITVFFDTRPLFDEGGEYCGAIAEVLDVTDRRRMEKEDFHAQKLKSLGILAGGIAHDFNNLLQAMVGNLDLAELEVPRDSGLREYFRGIRRAAGRAGDLCRQMLAYAGRGEFEVEDFDLGLLVKEMAGLISVSLDKKARLVMDLSPSLPRVHGDVTQLRQVVMNLITNASEALGGEPGEIRVSVGTEPASEGSGPGQVVLTVQDTGCGMDPETQQRLFDPFFSTKFSGRGLGMAAVRGIVDSHRGTITVDSIPLQGTTVRVALPASTGTLDKAGDGLSDRAGAGAGEAPLVLIADDEEMVLRILGQMLNILGYRVLTAHDGDEALAIFRRAGGTLAAVLLDLTMPRMDGQEVFLAIQAADPQMPVVIFSGFPAEDIALRFPEPRPAAFLQKPFSLEGLKLVLGPLLGSRPTDGSSPG
ncbi:PAS domain S-box protein [bacterium]|nr:PAS domain S-box protein [bacterium]